MARFVEDAAVSVSGMRGFQAAKFRAQLEKLPAAATDVYDFHGHRMMLERRLADLEAGRVVHLQRHELADELLAVAGLRSRWDQSGSKCWRIEGDQLVPEDYERVGGEPN